MYAGHNVKSLAVPQICVSSFLSLSLGTENQAGTLTNNKIRHCTIFKKMITLQIKWLQSKYTLAQLLHYSSLIFCVFLNILLLFLISWESFTLYHKSCLLRKGIF